MQGRLFCSVTLHLLRVSTYSKHMGVRGLGFGFLGCLFVIANAHADGAIPNGTPYPTNAWSKVLVPTPGLPLSLGAYANGCMSGASTIPLEGTGYQMMKIYRNRYYGQPSMVQFIANLGVALNATGSAMLISDVAQPRGGVLPYGHDSHQTGLDADIWYWTDPDQLNRSLTVDERNNFEMKTVLTPTGKVDPSLFTDETIQKLKLAATSPNVQRIFVNPAIKKYLCAKIPASEASWLHVLRPWAGHDDHFHVRLVCPSDSPDCTAQPEQTAGTGCNELSHVESLSFSKNSLAHEFSNFDDGDASSRMAPQIEALLTPVTGNSPTCQRVLKEVVGTSSAM